MMVQAVSVAVKLDSGPDDGRPWPLALFPLCVSLVLRLVETSSASIMSGGEGGGKDGVVSPSSSRVTLLVWTSLLAVMASIPLLFAAGTHLSCGGVDGMVSDAVAGLTSQDGASFGLAEFMRGETDGAPAASEQPGEGLARDVCRVAAYAVGSFSASFPSARFLVLRGPSDSKSAEAESGREFAVVEIEEKEKRGMFRRVVGRHRRKRKEARGRYATSAGEEVDRRHPVRHILEAASVFSHMKKEKKMRKTTTRGRTETKHDDEKGGAVIGSPSDDEVDWSKWRFGRSDDYVVRSDEVSLIRELAGRVLKRADEKACRDNESEDDTTTTVERTTASSCPESDLVFPSLSGGAPLAPYRTFLERADSVPWGGLSAESNRWYPRRDSRHPPAKISSHVDGGRLMSAYLKIMKWPPDLRANYPFRLCRDGCGSEVSALHTLEWREKYMPWCVSASGVEFNRDGFVYASGHSRPGRGQTDGSKAKALPYPLSEAGHSILWYRPGLATVDDPEVYGRVLINSLERAVSDSLYRNGGEVGRFNVVMDCAGMGSRNSPPLREVKRIFSFMQDHFPDRLGVLLVANLGTMPRMLMNLVLPFVTEDVRAKIHVIPAGEDERMAMLGQVMDADQVPGWLAGGRGGSASGDEGGRRRRNEFRAEEYYGGVAGACVLSDEEATEYLRSMPYHA